MPKALSTELRNEIATRYTNGQRANEIAVELAIHKTAVYGVLRRLGIKTNRTLVILDDTERLEVARQYERGDDAHDIAARFGCDYVTVYNIIRKLGVKTRCKPAVELTDKIREGVIALAKHQDMTAQEIAKNFNISKNSVFSILGSVGISIPNHLRIHTLDETVFDVLTPSTLYVAGFLWADGCVSRADAIGKRQPVLACSLGVKDREHVFKLRAFFGSTHAITDDNEPSGFGGGPMACFRVRSVKLCRALKRLGFAKKRERHPVPELAQSRDFWRGVIDGDGSLGVINHGERPHLHLVGQLPTLECYRDFLIANRLAKPEIKRTKTCCGVFIWGGRAHSKEASDIIRRLYTDNIFALARKDVRAQAIIRGDLKRSTPYSEGPAHLLAIKEMEAMNA